MKQGLVWRCSEDTPKQSVELAAKRFKEKFGSEPSICYVHPDSAKLDTPLKVVKSDKVAVNHLWLEIEETKETP